MAKQDKRTPEQIAAEAEELMEQQAFADKLNSEIHKGLNPVVFEVVKGTETQIKINPEPEPIEPANYDCAGAVEAFRTSLANANAACKDALRTFAQAGRSGNRLQVQQRLIQQIERNMKGL